MSRVERALISVHDKTGVADFARGLVDLGVEILSTGGTARLLRESGVPVVDVSQVTGFPEMLDGRVKTLHPKVHGGILARRDRPEHMAALEAHGIGGIDLVAVTLYPFEATVATPGVTLEEAIENIDIGGPSMIRARRRITRASPSSRTRASTSRCSRSCARARAASRPRRATGLPSKRSGGRRSTMPPSPRTCASPGRPVAARTVAAGPRAASPSVCASTGRWHKGFVTARTRTRQRRFIAWPVRVMVSLRVSSFTVPSSATTICSTGRPPSDSCSSSRIPRRCVIKHTNPCGVAIAPTVGEAMRKAKASDPVSIYGGIVGVNRRLDMEVVKELSGILLEILFAPAYEPDALAELQRTKKKCRIFQLPCGRADYPAGRDEVRSVIGGLLLQEADLIDLDAAALRVVSRRAPTPDEMTALRFAWRVTKHAKSNAIVLTTADQVVGVGAGQMNRVDSARIAVMRARELGLLTQGTVCGSDAFFPFRDGLDVVARAGATAVVHPGGSIRDDEAVAAADEHGMAMVVCGIRHFKH